MSYSPADRIALKLMLSFDGREAPPRILDWIAARPVAGFTLFRLHNYASPGQIRELVTVLQQAASAAGQPPLLIAADQEGGQLTAFGEGMTQFAGNMALGATRDADLTYRVGRAIGRELAATGVNVNYGPVCDLNTNPANPNIGVRAFSDDPQLTGALAAAMVAGLQSAGVAATLKHFPGIGAAGVDSHFAMPVVDHSRARLEAAELVPFRAGIDAGAQLIMTGHFAVPALTGSGDLPATLSPAVMGGLVRDELGFGGVTVTDALDMRAITQGAGQIVDIIAAVRAGVDLMLLMPDEAVQDRMLAGLLLGYSRGLIDDSHLDASAERILALKRWAASQPLPDLSVVGCAEHLALEAELARKSLTLVRNREGLLPLRLPADARVAAIMPRPRNLTPADVSSAIAPGLASSLRRYHPRVDEFVTGHPPAADEIAALVAQAAGYDLLVVGTLSASMHPPQADMVNALLATGVPTVTLALRTPYDLAVYPAAGTHLCTYGIQPSTMVALGDALFGAFECTGVLPVQAPFA